MKVIISLILACLVLVGIALYGLFIDDGSDATTAAPIATEVSQSAVPEEPQTFRGEAALTALPNLAGALECRISYDDPERLEPVVGTFFSSGNQIRSDFELFVPEMGGDMVSSVVIDGDWMYSWTRINGESFGVKANVAEMATANDSVSAPVPLDASVSYDCSQWPSVDGSVFVPPGDILFQDVTELGQAEMEYGTIYEEGEF